MANDSAKPDEDDLDAIATELQSLGVELRAGKSGRWRAAALPTGLSLEDRLWEGLSKLEHLARLEADGADVVDRHMTWIARLPRLTQLDLCHTGITDASKSTILSMSRLQLLRITGTQISKEALAEMRKTMLATRIVKL